MPFSGQEVSEKGFPQGWDADADSSTAQRIFRVTQLLEAMVFRPFSWDRFNSLALRYSFHGGYIDNGVDAWALIADGSVSLTNDALNFIERDDAGVVTVNQSGFTYLGFVPMAQIETSGGAFIPTSYIDRRPEIGGAPAGSSGGLISFSQIIGVILDSQIPANFIIDETLVVGIPQAYTVANLTIDRAYDANVTTLNEIADVLGTLIADLRTIGLVD